MYVWEACLTALLGLLHCAHPDEELAESPLEKSTKECEGQTHLGYMPIFLPFSSFHRVA